MASWITIGYTPQYEGCHRICFKTTGAQYCCYQDDSASSIGVAKSIDISLSDYINCLVTVPTEVGCGTGVVVDGYVQPCCSDANSNENRTAFTATFPTPTECNSYVVQCMSSDCGKFTVPDCYGQSIITPYELRSDYGSVNAIYTCSGGTGPDGIGYLIYPSPTPVCCTCKLYQVIVDSPIKINYTACDRTIDITTVQPGSIGTTVCAIEQSVWPNDKDDNIHIVSITEVGTCTENG